METLQFEYDAKEECHKRAHVGVVASGDLEVLLEPSSDQKASVTIRTGSEGFGDTWDKVLERFFASHPVAANIEINDFGATPGVVSIRLAQALEVSGNHEPA
ncbi:malonate decarboxylase subunit delta [Fictibacillus enclensis]|uniref:malonate decarboxylase subunit delta n=1 Tax=Fictibacillus enclensis TaxID=1017270 RepID=UPI0025A02EF0|nr:malonate decarboxylase subunit delta [Fictibacillus enclensis]MDM5198221.1 malonate decarboxylase subunit delta [Fictibacillus enclensis]